MVEASAVEFESDFMIACMCVLDDRRTSLGNLHLLLRAGHTKDYLTHKSFTSSNGIQTKNADMRMNA